MGRLAAPGLRGSWLIEANDRCSDLGEYQLSTGLSTPVCNAGDEVKSIELRSTVGLGPADYPSLGYPGAEVLENGTLRAQNAV